MLETFEVILENKYKSINPFNDNFTVIPLVIMDSCYMSTKNNWNEYLKLLDVTGKNNGILVINRHQCDFNEKEFPNHSKTYCKMIEEGKKRKAIFKTMSEYYTQIINNIDGQLR